MAMGAAFLAAGFLRATRFGLEFGLVAIMPPGWLTWTTSYALPASSMISVNLIETRFEINNS